MAFQNVLRDHTRLPTPPKDDLDVADISKAVDDALEYLDASLSSPTGQSAEEDNHATQSQPDTPPQSSPLPEKKREETSSSQRTKRLRFSNEASFCEAVSKPLLPSKLQTPSKSILKASDPSTKPYFPLVSESSTDLTVDHPYDPVTMLSSALKALAGEDKISRRDAYSSIWIAIKGHSDFPHKSSLLKSFPELELYLQRDIEEKAADSLNSRLLKLQALQLANMLVWTFPLLTLSNQFLNFLMDHCIQNLTAESTSKDVRRNYLSILATINVHDSCFTTERAARCLKALNSIPDRYPGKSVVQLRLKTIGQIASRYQNLVVEEIDAVIPHIMYAIFSEAPTNRSRAIETALILATCHRNRVAAAVRKWLEWKGDEEYSCFSHLETYLWHMHLSQPDVVSEQSHHVPQIWGVIMLLIRGDHSFLSHCLTRSSWVKIIEQCFNSSDIGLNRHAWMAWNRTIFAAHHLLPRNTRLLKKLCSPVFGCLQRSNSTEDKLKVKQEVHQSFALIIYYTFTQKLDLERIKISWETILGKFAERILKDEVDDLFRFGQVLCSLFSDSTLKFYNSQRALEIHTDPLDAKEVPRLDPIWIRNNVPTILKTLGPLLRQQHPPQHDVLFVKPVWKCLMKGISQAGEKEITVSAALSSAVVTVLAFIDDLWNSTLNSSGIDQHGDPISAENLIALMKISMDTLGPHHWGQDFLVQSTNGSCSLATTPPKFSSSTKTSKQCKSPLAFNLLRLSHPPPAITIVPSVRTAILDLIRTCVAARSSKSSKIDLILSCAASLETPTVANQRLIVPMIWQSLVEQLSEIIIGCEESADTTFCFRDCNNVLSTLRVGLRLSDWKSIKLGQSLFRKLAGFVRRHHSDAYFVVWVAEQWLQMLNQPTSDTKGNNLLQFSAILELDLPKPQSKSTEAVRKTLHDEEHLHLRGRYLLWPDILYTGIDSLLQNSYADLEVLEISAVHTFLCAVRTFIQSSQSQKAEFKDDIGRLVSKSSSGLYNWVQDESAKIQRVLDRGYDLSRPVRDLLRLVFTHIGGISISNHSIRLSPSFAKLYIAGFRSQSKSVANEAIVAWNKMLDVRENVEYSVQLSRILDRLSKYAEVQKGSIYEEDLTGVEINDSEDDFTLFPWLGHGESQQLNEPLQTPLKKQHHSSARRHRLKFQAPSPSPNRSTSTRKYEFSNQSSRRQLHNDSQIAFVSIDSSPISSTHGRNSQLTERQIEVKSRQREEATIFAGISCSSPSERKVQKPADTDIDMLEAELDQVGESANAPVDSDTVVESVTGPVQSELNLTNDDASQNTTAFVQLAPHSSCKYPRISGIFDDMESSENSSFVSESEKVATPATTEPLKEISLNAFHNSRIANTEGDKDKALSEDVTDRIEDSFLEPEDSQETNTSFITPSRNTNISPDCDEPNVVIEASGASSPLSSQDQSQSSIIDNSQSSALSQESQASSGKRGRKRKSSLRFTRTKKRKVLANSTAETTLHDPILSNGDSENDYDDPESTIAVEPADEDSPSLKDVLENLGVLEDAPEPPHDSQDPAARLQRSATLESSQSIQDSIETMEEAKKKRGRLLRSSQGTASPILSKEQPRESLSQNTSSEASTVIERLKSLINDVKTLSRASSDVIVKTELLTLGARLQDEIRVIPSTSGSS